MFDTKHKHYKKKENTSKHQDSYIHGANLAPKGDI